jgi:hypothetical protein
LAVCRLRLGVWDIEEWSMYSGSYSSKQPITNGQPPNVDNSQRRAVNFVRETVLV